MNPRSTEMMIYVGQYRFPDQKECISRTAMNYQRSFKRAGRTLQNDQKDTTYTKLWRIDGSFKVSEWKSLITDYFRDNYQIGNYFGGIDKKQEDRKRHGKESLPKDNECFFVAISIVQTRISSDNSIIIYSSEKICQDSIESLRKIGVVFNILDNATDTHKKLDILLGNKVVDAEIRKVYEILLQHHKTESQGKLFVYYLRVVFELSEETVVKLVVKGNCLDMIKWLSDKISIPPRKLSSFIEWLDDTKEFIKENYTSIGYVPISRELLEELI